METQGKLNGRFPMWGGDPWLEPLETRQTRRRIRRRRCKLRIRNFLHPLRLEGWENRVRAVFLLEPLNPYRRNPGPLARLLGTGRAISRP